MRKTRLLMLALVVALTALCTFASPRISQAVPEDYCWQFSNQHCVYYYYIDGCCQPLPNHPGAICFPVCD